MKAILKLIVALPAILFVVMGVRWLVNPSGISTELGFALAPGLGRSTQVGDFAAFFLTLGICMLVALVSKRRLWYYPPMMLLSLAAIGRIVAWAVHDAAFAGSAIVFELAVAALLLLALRWLPEQS